MKKIISKLGYFSKLEKYIWLSSVSVIILSNFFFGSGNSLVLFASLIGVTSLILNAKGNPIGQFLMVIFSLMYGLVSFGFAYYGEMITYLFMTMPMAMFSLVAWVKIHMMETFRK